MADDHSDLFLYLFFVGLLISSAVRTRWVNSRETKWNGEMGRTEGCVCVQINGVTLGYLVGIDRRAADVM